MRFFIKLIATNIKASFALRASFWMQAGFMALNNLMFFVIWWVLFDRFEEIRGYRIADMAALYGLGAAGYGVAAILVGALPWLSEKIERGDLDALLTQPRSVLLQAISARTRPDGWGDIASGVFLLALSGHVGLLEIPIAVLAVALCTSMFVATGVLVHSATFFVAQLQGLARRIQEFLLTFSSYPPTLFSGGLKLALFTIFPAGFIAYLPVELVRDFDPMVLAACLGATAAYASLAGWAWTRGLRRYASGNVFGVRDR